MPKKRSNLKQFQGSSTASGKQSAGNNGSNSPSVNERLSELRRLEGKDAERKKAELAESSNAKSVPPSLRGILGIPDSAPPKPKRGVRTRLPDRTRTPGPAPPASWAKTSGWTPLLALRTGRRRFKKSSTADDERTRPDILMRFARMIDGSDQTTNNGSSSLLHLSLKTAAEQWILFDEDDYPALADLPLRLRSRLISYISFYGSALTVHEIEALVQGNETLSHLDLAGLIGHGDLSVKSVTKLAKQQVSEALLDEENVLDSWDQEDSLEMALRPGPATKFEHLTHLSLSHPGRNVSWRDLLSLSKQLAGLSHLSLAHWPRPTLTPNLSTTSVTSQHSPDIAAGGSHYYSVLDEDLYEPAVILRQLSASLLRLVWLDLEGCTEWAPALAYHGDTHPARLMRSREDEWQSTSSATSVFLRNWKKLTYINCSQGWLPDAAILSFLAWKVNSTQRDIIEKFAHSVPDPHPSEQSSVLDPVSQRNALSWLELEERARSTERKINALRRDAHVSQVTFDHGWSSRP